MNSVMFCILLSQLWIMKANPPMRVIKWMVIGWTCAAISNYIFNVSKVFL